MPKRRRTSRKHERRKALLKHFYATVEGNTVEGFYRAPFWRLRCWFCGGVLRHKDITVEHLVPKSKGGQDYRSNTVPSCWKCNQKVEVAPFCVKLKRRLKLRNITLDRPKQLCLVSDPLPQPRLHKDHEMPASNQFTAQVSLDRLLRTKHYMTISLKNVDDEIRELQRYLDGSMDMIDNVAQPANEVQHGPITPPAQALREAVAPAAAAKPAEETAKPEAAKPTKPATPSKITSTEAEAICAACETPVSKVFEKRPTAIDAFKDFYGSDVAVGLVLHRYDADSAHYVGIGSRTKIGVEKIMAVQLKKAIQAAGLDPDQVDIEDVKAALAPFANDVIGEDDSPDDVEDDIDQEDDDIVLDDDEDEDEADEFEMTDEVPWLETFAADNDLPWPPTKPSDLTTLLKRSTSAKTGGYDAGYDDVRAGMKELGIKAMSAITPANLAAATGVFTKSMNGPGEDE